MAHELTHAEASELLGVYALDALDADERDAVELHLVGCVLCRAEVMEHVEVAGLLASGLAGPPAAVWDRIAEDLVGTPPPLDLAPIHALRRAPPVPRRVGTGTGPVSSDELAERRSRDRGRGRGVRIGALVAAATIAASVIGVLGVKVIDDGRRIDNIAAGTPREQLDRTIHAAMADPTAVRVDMRSPDGAIFAEAWVLPDGRGYLARNNLPILGPDRNYQMWAVVGGNKISVGVLGSTPEAAAFVASGPVAALAITAETAGGVVSTLQQPVVVGLLTRA